MLEPDYDDPIFLEAVDHLVAEMAKRYDGDPAVSFFAIGLYGMWGEGHTVLTTPSHGHSWGVETQKKMIDIYTSHFKKTQLCISDDYAGHNDRRAITSLPTSFQALTLRFTTSKDMSGSVPSMNSRILSGDVSASRLHRS